MGLYQIWKIDSDPDDAANPYTPYTFEDKVPSIDWGLQRRESITVIPGMDGVLDGYGNRRAGPLDKRTITYGFRVMTKNGPTAAHDLLMQAIMGDETVRLVNKTETGYLRFNTATLLNTVEGRTNDENIYYDFKVQWRIRPDWRPRYNELTATPDVYSPLDNEVYSALDDDTFPAPGTFSVLSTNQAFTIDARGTPGSDLPTLPDNSPIFFLTGPIGGTLGIEVVNYSSTVIDGNGFRQPRFFTLGFELPTSSDTCLLDFGKQSYWHNGIPFRPFKPDYQPEYFQVKNGIINNCAIIGLGTAVSGGSVTLSWWRKFA